MKYWRGYLVAAIFAAVTLALRSLGQKFTTLVDMVYPYVTRTVQNGLVEWSAGVSFCIWQLAAILLILLGLASIVLMILLRWNPIQWLGWVLSAASIVFFLHTAVYGLNYYNGSISDDVRMEMAEYTLDELEKAAIYYRDQANALAMRIPRDENGDPKYPEFEELALQAEEGFHSLTYDRCIPIFAGNMAPVKKLGWASLYTSSGITGVTFALTGEAAVNPEIPSVSMPYTMCHEMSHRLCIAREDDANFAAFLACQANPRQTFQYSAYFMAYRYCYRALRGVNSTLASEAAARIQADVCPELKRDIAAYDAFFNTRRNDTTTKVVDTANDTYIKASGDSQGIQAYDAVCDLLVSWYIQEYDVSDQEEEVTFDPFDPAQVDLTGLPHGPTAPTEEPTEATEPTETTEP